MIDVLMKKGNAYRAADGSVYFKVSSFPDYGKLSRVKERELQVGQRRRRRRREGRRQRLRALEGLQDRGRRQLVGQPVGPRPPRLAHRVQRDEQETPRRDDRPPHRRRGPALPAPRERDRPKPVLQRHDLRPPLVSQRAPARGRQEDEQVARQLLHARRPRSKKGYSARWRCATPCSPCHPRKQLNFTLDSLHAAESALPSALGALFTIINEFNPSAATISDYASLDRALTVLGIDIPTFIESALKIPSAITALAEKRWAAKQAKDWNGADAFRKELAAAGWNMKDAKDSYTLELLKK
jgi:cysteinyl-tRNA synthetase